MKKSTVFLGFSALMALFVATLTMVKPLEAHADTGPKPSTTITLVGMETVDTYYVALLADQPRGPWWIVNSLGELSEYVEETDAIDERILEYVDPDGFHYTTMGYATCSGNREMTWGYFPPDPFKVLIYIPASDAFAVTPNALHRTTFDSYFKLSLEGQTYLSLSPNEVVTIDPSTILNTYDVLDVVLGFLGRVVLTLVIELGLAWLFHLRSKKQLLTILVVNVATQVALNLAFNLFYLFEGGGLLYWLVFALLEAFVFIAEATFYKLFFMAKAKTHPQDYVSKWVIIYAFLANLLSMGIGILISLFWDFTHF